MRAAIYIASSASMAVVVRILTIPQPLHGGGFRNLPKLRFCSAPSPSPSPRQLILYSKPGCCLCDGLKEKLQSALMISCPNIQLQIRDISTNPEWETRFQYEIPVLARVLEDGTEEILPRLSPRLGVELVHKKITDAFR